MSDSDEEVKGSRLGRFARLGWLSRRSVPLAFSRLKGLAEAGVELDPKKLAKHLKAAEDVFGTLGDMKGLALKAGQMLSYMDGALPPEVQPVYREALSRLQASAPAMGWPAVEKVLVEELGPQWAERFTELEETPFAAASIGQVHRGVLPDGTEVAVKVQYPGIEKAMGSDLDNLDTMKAVFAPLLLMAGGNPTIAWTGEIFQELRERLMEELDYAHEAKMQRHFATLVDPEEIIVPEVYDLSTGRVLVTTLYRGRTLDEVAEQDDQSARDRWGTILTRGICDSLYGHGVLYADPHPGNYLFTDEGKVVWLDFGCTKRLDARRHAGIARYITAACIAVRTGAPEDMLAFETAICEELNIDRNNELIFNMSKEFLLYCFQPLTHDVDWHFTPEFTGGTMELILEAKRKTVLRKGIPRVEMPPAIPADYTFLNRLQWGFFSVLTRLGARVNWYRLMPEGWRG